MAFYRQNDPSTHDLQKPPPVPRHVLATEHDAFLGLSEDSVSQTSVLTQTNAVAGNEAETKAQHFQGSPSTKLYRSSFVLFLVLLYASFASSLTINFDYGSDTEVPTISRMPMIIISVLLFIHLAALFGMAIYASHVPKWSNQLDSFAMMRIGAAIGGERIPLMVGMNRDKIRVLDEIPGWIGDRADGDDEGVGVLGLGAEGRVDGGRRYESVMNVMRSFGCPIGGRYIHIYLQYFTPMNGFSLFGKCWKKM